MTPPIKMSGSIERPSAQLASPTDKAVPLAPDFYAGGGGRVMLARAGRNRRNLRQCQAARTCA